MKESLAEDWSLATEAREREAKTKATHHVLLELAIAVLSVSL
jgi:hypothetical protein